MLKCLIVKFAAAAAFASLAAGAAAAQDVGTVDPNAPGTWDNAPAEAPAPAETQTDTEAPAGNEWFPAEQQAAEAAPAEAPPAAGAAPATSPAAGAIPRHDIFDAAENLFGDGAEGLAGLLERILADQGEPVAYISGSEASGAFVFGVRYGSGVMRHRVEGDRNVYWTGPSLGFDFGADANKVFVLVYNLHDSQRLFRRYPGGEGNAYFVGGFTASYLRRGDVVLIPVRMGVGLRLGVNAGYMRFSERSRWLPF